MLSYTSLFPPIGQPFTVLPTVDSTNNYAMAQAQKGLASHGSVFLALEQTAGKGQRGKSWLTAPGENIMMSVIVEPGGLFITEQFILSASVALGCYDFFKKYAGADDTKIKWPNDVYWQDRKAGGILVESNWGLMQGGESTGPGWKFAIVGIGININQTLFDESIRKAVSLKQITGKTWDIIQLARDLCESLDFRFREIFNRSQEEIMEEYNRVLYKIGETVRLKKDMAVFETTINSVSKDGRLNTADTLERSFTVGDVEWVI